MGEPFLGGIVRADDGSLYVTYATGTAELTGVWRLSPEGGAPRRIAALPAEGLPNGIALDSRSGQLYVTDSVTGVVRRVPVTGGRAVIWSTDPLLAPGPEGFAGANGIRVHRGAVWVTHHDRGTVLRFPVTGSRSAPTAGRPETVVEGLGEIDDLEFTGDGDGFLVAGVTDSRVLLVPDGGDRPGAERRRVVSVLDGEDGLQNPSALARHGSSVYIANSAHYTLTDPHILLMPGQW
ncbi:SMP-30/gluconolactonase/LRE family protein [Streptomyces sp. NPDC058953]|uniref:SMP-30/gluconolactonase/LRE family protein n=1 Tax=Streptomyces sp. NPDC058953 TaxID=3346676 RepID=UPI003687E428